VTKKAVDANVLAGYFMRYSSIPRFDTISSSATTLLAPFDVRVICSPLVLTIIEHDLFQDRISRFANIFAYRQRYAFVQTSEINRPPSD